MQVIWLCAWVQMIIGENETKIYFVLIKKEHPRFVQNVKVIPWTFQQALVVADIDEKKIRNVVGKACTDEKKISLLNDLKIMK